MGESETERVEEKIIGGFVVTLYLLKFETNGQDCLICLKRVYEFEEFLVKIGAC